MSLKNKALQGVFWSVVDRLVNQLGYFLLLLYLARVLTPEDFGLIGMLTIFMLLADNIANAGFFQALVQKSNKVTEQDFSTVFVLNLGISLALYIILFVAAPWIAVFYHEPLLIDLSRVLFLVLIINALCVVPKAKLTINVDFKCQAHANSISVLLSSVVAIVAVKLGCGYWSLVFLNLIKSITMCGALFFYAHWKPSLLFNKDSFKQLFGFGSKLLLASIASTFVGNLYMVLIGKFFKTQQVGYFSQATNLSNFLSNTITSILQGVTYPVLTSVQDDPVRLAKIYKQVVAVTMFIALPCMIGLAAIADLFVRLFLNDQWLPMVPILVALSIARIVTPISMINMNIVNAIGRSDLFFKVEMIKLPMTLLVLLLTVKFGITIVAYGMIFTSFIAFFINAYYPGKMYAFGGWQQLKVMFPMILAAVFMYLAMYFMTLHNLWLSLITKLIVGAFVYILSCYLFKVQALSDIFVILQRKRGKLIEN